MTNQKTVLINFNGEMGSGKTLLINLLKKTLKLHGITVTDRNRGEHKVEITLNDEDRIKIANL